MSLSRMRSLEQLRNDHERHSPPSVVDEAEREEESLDEDEMRNSETPRARVVRKRTTPNSTRRMEEDGLRVEEREVDVEGEEGAREGEARGGELAEGRKSDWVNLVGTDGWNRSLFFTNDKRRSARSDELREATSCEE